MKITVQQMQALNTGFRAEFEKSKGATISLYQLIATVIGSTSASNTYGWLGEMPNMREWVGERVLNEISAHGYSITNKTFEATVKVKREDIEDDNIGIYSPMMAELGRNAALHPDQLVFSLLAKGITELCYDGKPFFAVDHPVMDGVVSNFEGVANGTSWYLLDLSRPLKPLIFQDRKKSVFTAMNKADDESVFMSNFFRYGVDSRCNVGFGFWQMALCSQQVLTETNFEAAYTKMRSQLNESGNPLGIKPTHIVVPPSLHSKALALMAQTTANGASNILYDRVKILEVDWLIANPVATPEPEAPAGQA